MTEAHVCFIFLFDKRETKQKLFLWELILSAEVKFYYWSLNSIYKSNTVHNNNIKKKFSLEKMFRV